MHRNINPILEKNPKFPATDYIIAPHSSTALARKAARTMSTSFLCPPVWCPTNIWSYYYTQTNGSIEVSFGTDADERDIF